MTKRIVEINIDSSMGNKLYSLIKELMKKYPNEIRDVGK
jgi:hypothetical protein